MHFISGLLIGSIATIVGIGYLSYEFPTLVCKVFDVLQKEVKK